LRGYPFGSFFTKKELQKTWKHFKKIKHHTFGRCLGWGCWKKSLHSF
jgi:hypothetical protein